MIATVRGIWHSVVGDDGSVLALVPTAELAAVVSRAIRDGIGRDDTPARSCPMCHADDSVVGETRHHESTVARVRRCQSCGGRWRTVERTVWIVRRGSAVQSKACRPKESEET